MSALDDQAKKVRAAIAGYDVMRKVELRAKVPGGMVRLEVDQATLRLIGETEALLTILDQQREPI